VNIKYINRNIFKIKFILLQLYNQYAHPLGLHEEELLIFYTSGYKDPQLIESTWNAIINNSKFILLIR